ncbi:MAG: hypothetical protein LQ337_008048 [Flavoplaca oasis]|nr:MAG: hypothetical protein LQ337_008048 [Flavoplaca oasis]
MLKRKQPVGGQSMASHSKRAKRLPRIPSQPFRFGELPEIIRNRIYHLCLINEHPTSIVVEENFGWDGERLNTGQIYNAEELVRLTTKTHRQPHLDSDLTASLVRINSTIHQEAAPILYGLNTFSFTGRNCWLDLMYFDQRLTELSRRNIRTVAIDFPEVDRGYHELDKASVIGMKSLKKFPALASLMFLLYEDILTSDIDSLRKIRDTVSTNCNISVDVRRSSLYHEDGGWDNRPVRISSEALRKMQKWGWAMKGKWELVDERHRLRREKDWLEWLRQNNRRGVRFGYVEEPGSLHGDCIFYM